MIHHLITAKKTVEVTNEDGTVSTVSGKKEAWKTIFGTIDYTTVLFLIFLFVLIRAVDRVGIIADIANFFGWVGEKGSIFLLYTLIVFGSVLISAFIDNIPYVATMLPIIAALGYEGNVFTLLCFGLLCGQHGTRCKVRVATAWRSHSFMCSDLLAPRTGPGSVIHSVQAG